MKVLHNQVLATTGTDLHGDQIPEERLRELFAQIPDPWLLANQHDLSLPPMARAVGKRLVQLENGDWSIQADIEVLDDSAFDGKRGYSIAYLGHQLTVDSSRHGEVEILFNPRVFPSDEISKLVSLSTSEVQVDARELIQKGLEATVVLVLKFGGVALFTGFLAKAGADVWEALRDGLKSLAKSRHAAQGEVVVTQLHFLVDVPSGQVEVLIDVPIQDYPLLEGDLPLVESALQQVQEFSLEASVTKVALRFARDPNHWQVCYYINGDGEVVVPETAPV